MNAPAEPKSFHLLLVENHVDTLRILQMHLKSLGHRVVPARNMNEAVAALADDQYDIFLSDIGLPDGDGWQLMRRVLEHSPRAYGIAMSGYGTLSDREKSKAAGFRHHLLKPFSPDELETLLVGAERHGQETVGVS